MRGEDIMGKITGICISEKRGVQKHFIEEANIIADWGIEGDAHGGKWHRQISLLSQEKVDAFKAKGADIHPGSFGENLIVEGFDFSAMPVGTRFVIGDVVLEMTQIGKECHNHCVIYKKMGDCIMPKEGVFAEVVEGGHIKVGQEVTCILPKADRPYTAAVITLSDKGAGLFYRKFFKNAYIRAMAGGFLVIGITLLIGTYDYNGAGTEMIAKAIEGSVPAYAFLLKMLLTALTLAAGYKGGEIVPAFFTGATFGCLFGHVFGISPSLCAATGMLALFCGVTNCPIASMLIGFELFGFEGVPYILIAISISYMLSGYHGLYKEQIIVYSKYHPKFINRQSGDESFDGQDYE